MRTPLGERRVQRGLTQVIMSSLTGIPISTYRRLERGQVEDPNLRHLVNCATVLGCTVEQLIDDEWREWRVLNARSAPAPPDEDTWRRVAYYLEHIGERKYDRRVWLAMSPWDPVPEIPDEGS